MPGRPRTMADRSYAGLDEALVPLHRHLELLMPEHLPGVEVGAQAGMTIEALELEMPIELDVLAEPAGGVSLGSSPPLYYVATGFESARHRLRVTIVEERELFSRD